MMKLTLNHPLHRTLRTWTLTSSCPSRWSSWRRRSENFRTAWRTRRKRWRQNFQQIRRFHVFCLACYTNTWYVKTSTRGGKWLTQHCFMCGLVLADWLLWACQTSGGDPLDQEGLWGAACQGHGVMGAPRGGEGKTIYLFSVYAFCVEHSQSHCRRQARTERSSDGKLSGWLVSVFRDYIFYIFIVVTQWSMIMVHLFCVVDQQHEGGTWEGLGAQAKDVQNDGGQGEFCGQNNRRSKLHLRGKCHF